MADLVTLPVSPLTADRIRSRSSWASSVVDGAPHDRSVSPRLGNYHPGRLLAPQGAEYPSFPSAQVHTRGGSPPERARDCHPCDLAPLHYRSPVPLPITDPADRLGPTSVAFPIVHSCTMFGSVPAACQLWCMFCTFMRTSDVSRRISRCVSRINVRQRCIS